MNALELDMARLSEIIDRQLYGVGGRASAEDMREILYERFTKMDLVNVALGAAILWHDHQDSCHGDEQ